MTTDINGCSTCQAGKEQYEMYTQKLGRRVYNLVQYDYRHTDGDLFSTVAPTLEEARRRRDRWIEVKGKRKVGDLVTLHFNNPASVGYNGAIHVIMEVLGEGRYVTAPYNGTGSIICTEANFAK